MMKVLVIGKGGREHALCWRISQSPGVERVFCASGNPGITQNARLVAIEPSDIAGLADFAGAQRIDLTVVGPEDPLALGIADEFERRGLTIFGPSQAASRLEASKAFAKTVMREAGVPTAAAAVFDNADEARRFVREHGGAMVVKADGLALGKGVVVCDDAASALAAIDDAMERRLFGAAGERLVIEERLRGEEVSFFALCDGERAVPIGLVQDHKTVFDGDRGPNTGGMGAYSPLPQFGPGLEARIMSEVVTPTMAAMRARGTPFRGVLFVGLMIDGERMNVLEYNVRFGDPECEALMMRFEGDLAGLLLAAANGDATRASAQLSPESVVAVVLASGGYPGDYRSGIEIRGVAGAEAIDGVRVFHSGTAIRDGSLVTKGGRVMVVCARARDLRQAAVTAYRAADLIEFEGKHLRRDIGLKALNRTRPGAGGESPAGQDR
ncbi:MAG: phosphoribosylamine--glycine ligase [Candidatus Binataceae bacterium]|jgi:phosphoribosylamine--glycine ligase